VSTVALPSGVSRLPAAPARIAVLGLGALAVYACFSTFAAPAGSTGVVDSELFRYFAATNFAYGGSALDLSVMSPFQGLAGLSEPLGVWVNPAYVLPHILACAEPNSWGLIVMMFLMGLATFFLGRAMGLPAWPAMLAAQSLVIFSFPPIYSWSQGITHLNGVLLYRLTFGTAVPTILGTLLLAVFSGLGKASTRWNIAAVVLMPCLVVYSVLCDPLYTLVFFCPIAVLLAGVFFGSGSRSVFRWRAIGALVCLLVCLACNLHGFYRAVTGYAARAVFPNELYVEVQQWDLYTGLLFQGGLATAGVMLLIVSCSVAAACGTAQSRGFAISVLVFLGGVTAASLVYVYSGIHWGLPLPVYFEVAAQPAYAVAGLLGLWIGRKRLAARFPAWKLRVPRALSGPDVQSALVYVSIFALPLAGMTWVLAACAASPPGAAGGRNGDADQPRGIVRYLQDELAIGEDGRFRGSVASVVGVPGGGLMARYGVPAEAPFSKAHINFLQESYLRSFDPHFFLAGFWSLRIPTLEDNCQMVTPPFHFLVSRALSRPQDYHSRNWTFITKANPKLLAALGARFLLADSPQSDPRLSLRARQSNADGVTVYAYEIQGANLGGLSPVRTVVSTDAAETISRMTGDDFRFADTAVVDVPLPGSLVRADEGALYFEHGGVRVRAKSQGPALLVLPVQFSNSLRILETKMNSRQAPVRFQRVDLLLAGLLFEGRIDVKFAHVFGPFRGTDGRMRDIEDCRRLGIRETGEIPYPPNYQPLGPGGRCFEGIHEIALPRPGN
jgi:hypothetical protein